MKIANYKLTATFELTSSYESSANTNRSVRDPAKSAVAPIREGP